MLMNRNVSFFCKAVGRLSKHQFQQSYSIHRSFETETTAGEAAYKLYLETLQQLKQFQEQKERAKSEKLFQAWKQTQQNDDVMGKSNAKQAGVAVVRTLAKHSQASASVIADQQQRELQDRANALLRTAAEEWRHPAALVHLGNHLMHDNDDPSQKDRVAAIQAALDYYRAAGEQELSEGWFNLGHCLWTGIDGLLESDTDAALEAFDRAIALGDCDAMYFVGVHRLGQYDHDADISTIDDAITIQPFLQQALQWIEHAAADSHGGALHYLAIFYLNGYAPLQIAPCETAEFVLRLEAAIQHDTTTGDSHFLRGSCYYAGDSGYPHDVRKALEDFLVASDLGHADAAVNAGAILHRGVTGLIAPDRQRAFALYQHAGEMGSLDGWRNVVACYATGDGVKQSMETAKYIAETMLREKGQ